MSHAPYSTNRKHRRRVLRLAAKILAFPCCTASIGSGVAHAGELRYPAYGAAELIMRHSDFIRSPVPRDMTYGERIGYLWSKPGFAVYGVNCDIKRESTIHGTPLAGTTNLYPTNVPGIAARYSLTDEPGGLGGEQPSIHFFTPTGSQTTEMRADSFAWIDFIVVGQVGAGRVVNLPTMTVRYSGSCFKPVTVTLQPLTYLIATEPTCKIGKAVTTVPLLPIAVKDLLPIGQSSGLKRFDLDVTCSGGSTVYMTVSDANDSSNVGNLLTPGPESSAHGVKLRMLREGSPLNFGPDSAQAGTPNQFRLGTAANINQIPLSVEYVSVGPVSSGVLTGQATFTLSYQ